MRIFSQFTSYAIYLFYWTNQIDFHSFFVFRANSLQVPVLIVNSIYFSFYLYELERKIKMNDPELYTKSNALQKRDVKEILEQYSNLFKWKNDGSESFIDIGCGSGDVTMEILLPLLPKNIKSLIGTDISADGINFCKKHFENGAVSFQQSDIAAEDEVKMLPKANFITSFFCLNWVEKQRSVLNSINFSLTFFYEMGRKIFEKQICMGSLEKFVILGR